MTARKQYLLRIDPALWGEVEKVGRRRAPDVNAQVEYLLRDAVRRRRGGRAAGDAPEAAAAPAASALTERTTTPARPGTMNGMDADVAANGSLELIGLRRSFGELAALDGLTFNVPAGQVFGFLGLNGAGKTTAMRAVVGVIAPDAGEIRWRGAPVDAAARRTFGYMPEERGLYPGMVVLEQLEYLGRLYGMTAAEARVVRARMDRAARHRRQAGPEDRDAVAGQPAARAARRRTRARARAAHPRRAVLGARPGGRRRHERSAGGARRRRSRRACSRATSSTSCRTSARRSPSSTAGGWWRRDASRTCAAAASRGSRCASPGTRRATGPPGSPPRPESRG